MGDILTFAEKAQEQVDEKQARELAKKLRRNEFTLDDFRDQLLRLRKMGSVEDLLGMIPGMAGKMKELKGMAPDETELKKTVAIIDSMTAQERRNAKLLNGSRRKRIASGSGTTVQDVNRLMKNFQAAEEMIKRMTKGGKKGMGRNLPFFR
jgi:signal recognition particle subunit SRP54